MANMSYCRFRNTSADLSDCLDAIANREETDDIEIRIGRAMFREFLEFCQNWGVIDGFDKDALNDLFEPMREDKQE